MENDRHSVAVEVILVRLSSGSHRDSFVGAIYILVVMS
jgi:hypothetical protein